MTFAIEVPGYGPRRRSSSSRARSLRLSSRLWISESDDHEDREEDHHAEGEVGDDLVVGAPVEADAVGGDRSGRREQQAADQGDGEQERRGERDCTARTLSTAVDR